MKRNRIASLLMVGAILLCLSGCGEPAIKPTVAVLGMGGLKPDVFGSKAELKLEIQNPHPEAMELEGIVIDIKSHGKAFAKGTAPLRGSIPAFGSITVKVPVTISSVGMFRAGMRTAKTARVVHAMTSRVTYRVAGKRFTATVRKNGEMPLGFLKK